MTHRLLKLIAIDLGREKGRRDSDSGLMYFYLDIQLILYTHPHDKDPALGTQALLESQLGCFMDLLPLYPSMEDYEERTGLSPPAAYLYRPWGKATSNNT